MSKMFFRLLGRLDGSLSRQRVRVRFFCCAAATLTIFNRCNDLRSKITQLTDGEYAVAKRDVDRLRGQLGQPPMPNLQETLEEKTTQ